MLRLCVVLLALANLGYWGWTQGWLADMGWAPAQPRESYRMEQQLRPQALRMLSADEARKLEAAAPVVRPPECLQAGIYPAGQSEAWRQALDGVLAPSQWDLQDGVEAGRWLIYMGPYASVEQLNRKKAELRYRNVPFELPRNPALEPGLILGSFDSAVAAQEGLAQLGKRGVRTARVEQERAELKGFWVRLPVVDEALRARLEEFKPLMAGKIWRSCR